MTLLLSRPRIAEICHHLAAGRWDAASRMLPVNPEVNWDKQGPARRKILTVALQASRLTPAAALDWLAERGLEPPRSGPWAPTFVRQVIVRHPDPVPVLDALVVRWKHPRKWAVPLQACFLAALTRSDTVVLDWLDRLHPEGLNALSPGQDNMDSWAHVLTQHQERSGEHLAWLLAHQIWSPPESETVPPDARPRRSRQDTLDRALRTVACQLESCASENGFWTSAWRDPATQAESRTKAEAYRALWRQLVAAGADPRADLSTPLSSRKTSQDLLDATQMAPLWVAMDRVDQADQCRPPLQPTARRPRA